MAALSKVAFVVAHLTILFYECRIALSGGWDNSLGFERIGKYRGGSIISTCKIQMSVKGLRKKKLGGARLHGQEYGKKCSTNQARLWALGHLVDPSVLQGY
jgi:hypothetical protein